MAWPERVIKDWVGFKELVGVFENEQGVSPTTPSVLARGQSKSEWSLQSSLSRALGGSADTKRAIGIEANIVERFKQHCGGVAGNVPLPADDQMFEWWALVQHYGGPTRLIDWTTSPYVAAYFAVAENWQSDGAIWILTPWAVFEAAKELVDPDSPLEQAVQGVDAPHVVVALPARRPSDRMIAQQSHFTVCINATADQGNAIETMLSSPRIPDEDKVHFKLVLPKELKLDFLQRLNEMGVSARTLFPGLDGLGQSLTEYARLAQARYDGQPPRRP